MTAPISESWTRIEEWLAEYAPASYAALAPPADPADIAAVERVIGRPLLKPLAVSLLRHDGFRNQFQGSLLAGRYRSISARETAVVCRSHSRNRRKMPRRCVDTAQSFTGQRQLTFLGDSRTGSSWRPHTCPN